MPQKRTTGVLLGLGANLGTPIEQLEEAVRCLRKVLHRLTVSSIYRSAPVGYRDQPNFFNLVCSGTTDLSPVELLMAVQGIERQLGRSRSFPNAPRLIDIDILAFGDLVLHSPELVIPHPRLHERAFVLVPLAEIAADWCHPVFGKTPAELLADAGPLEPAERLQEV